MDEWHVIADVESSAQPTPEQYARAHEALGQFTAGPRQGRNGDQLRLSFVMSEHLDMAAAVRRVDLITATLGVTGQITRIEFITDYRLAAENAFPDYVNSTEAGGILGVTRQRASKLARTDPDFPEGVPTPNGTYWIRSEVQAYHERRQAKKNAA